MSNGRKSLDIDDFQPRPQVASHNTQENKKAVDKISNFPSREASEDAQINIKASNDALDRFRTLAKAERYRHGEFLEVLMDAYESK